MVGMIAGAAAGAGLNMLGSAMNAATQYGSAKALSKYNYELGQKSLRNSPSNYKEGLERAGINPILASNSPIGSTQGSSGVNPGMDLASAASKGSSAVQYKRATDSQIKVNDAQANSLNSNAQANMLNAQANMKNAETNEKGLTLGYTNTVVNGLNNAAGGTVVPLINGQKHAEAIKQSSTKGLRESVKKAADAAPVIAPAPVANPGSAKAIKDAAVVPTPSSAKGAKGVLGTMTTVGGSVVAPAAGYVLGQYALGKYLESKGYGANIKGPNPKAWEHRTGGKIFKDYYYKNRRHN